MAKKIMIQGTTSNAGKSLMVTGLCRIFQSQGYKVAPYKPQNMALNSFVTEDGLEIGRAQAVQASACKILPKAEMNTILLKPTKEKSIQVIVHGKVVGNMSSLEYHEYKKTLLPILKADFEKLEQEYDIIVMEGAGSPAEINMENDISNMVMAQLVDAPVIIVGDIDKGGVFASLYGTIMLQEDKYQERIKGYIINKYRGNKAILDSGIAKLTALTNKQCIGIQMYEDFDIEEEDGVSERFSKKPLKAINIACIKLPHISNYTDFAIFEQMENVAVHYVDKKDELSKVDFDMIIIPGSKNTIQDLKWLKETKIDEEINKYRVNRVVFGICGGYQMLGELLEDPYGFENGGEEKGLGMLKSKTVFSCEKKTVQVEGIINELQGQLKNISGMKYSGYEIHSGVTNCDKIIESDGKRVYGTYVHGIFDQVEIALEIIKALAKRRPTIKDLDYTLQSQEVYKEKQFDALAKSMEKNIDIEAIKKIMGLK